MSNPVAEAADQLDFLERLGSLATLVVEIKKAGGLAKFSEELQARANRLQTEEAKIISSFKSAAIADAKGEIDDLYARSHNHANEVAAESARIIDKANTEAKRLVAIADQRTAAAKVIVDEAARVKAEAEAQNEKQHRALRAKLDLELDAHKDRLDRLQADIARAEKVKRDLAESLR